jgi:hypothetical protein
VVWILKHREYDEEVAGNALRTNKEGTKNQELIA